MSNKNTDFPFCSALLNITLLSNSLLLQFNSLLLHRFRQSPSQLSPSSSITQKLQILRSFTVWPCLPCLFKPPPLFPPLPAVETINTSVSTAANQQGLYCGPGLTTGLPRTHSLTHTHCLPSVPCSHPPPRPVPPASLPGRPSEQVLSGETIA